MSEAQNFAVQIAVKRMKEAEQRLISLESMKSQINMEIANTVNILDTARSDFSELMEDSGIR